MAKEQLKVIESSIVLYRDTKTGIAWIENGRTGQLHSAHPNIDSTGSIRGMKDRGYWGKKDKCVRTRGAIYNISVSMNNNEYDKIAQSHCQCGGDHSCD